MGALAPQAADGRLAKAARRALQHGRTTGGDAGLGGVLAPWTPPRALTQDDLWPLWQAGFAFQDSEFVRSIAVASHC